MLPWSADLAGRIEEHVIDSALLRGNPLGDPHERPVLVYLPPGAALVLPRWLDQSRRAPLQRLSAADGGLRLRHRREA